jgi:hypothetical protein
MLLFSVPYRCISTSVLQGTIESSLLPHGVQDIKAQLFATILGVVS